MLKIKPKIQPSAVEFSVVKVKIPVEVLENFNAALETFSAENPTLEVQNLNAFLTQQVAILLKKATQHLQKKRESVATSEGAFAGSEPSNTPSE